MMFNPETQFIAFEGQRHFTRPEMEERFDNAISDMQPDELALTFTQMKGEFVFLDEASIRSAFKIFKKAIKAKKAGLFGGMNQRSFTRHGREYFYLVINDITDENPTIDPLGLAFGFTATGMIYVFRHRVNRDAIASYLCSGNKKEGTDTFCTLTNTPAPTVEPVQVETLTAVFVAPLVGECLVADPAAVSVPLDPCEFCEECQTPIIHGSCGGCKGDPCEFCGERSKCKCLSEFVACEGGEDA